MVAEDGDLMRPPDGFLLRPPDLLMATSCDLLQLLAARGLRHVVELILSYLDPPTLAAAERVSPLWARVVATSAAAYRTKVTRTTGSTQWTTDRVPCLNSTISAPGSGVLAAGAGAAVAGLPRGARPPPAGGPRQLRGRGHAAGGRARQVLTTCSCCS